MSQGQVALHFLFGHVVGAYHLFLVVICIFLDLVLSVICIVALLPSGLWSESAWLQWVSCVS